jgi:hypothetical protein
MAKGMSEKRRGALAEMRKLGERLLRLLWIYQEGPALETGEEVILEGIAVFLASVMTTRSGPLILTNRRLIWYERPTVRPLKPIYGEVRLSDIDAVEKGTLLERIFWNKNIGLHLRGGRRKTLNVDRPDEWVAAIRQAIASQN